VLEVTLRGRPVSASFWENHRLLRADTRLAAHSNITVVRINDDATVVKTDSGHKAVQVTEEIGS